MVFSWNSLDILSHETPYKEEIELISQSTSEKRRKELALGRITARHALKKFGYLQQTPLLKGSEGEVLWPEGIVGSISHSGKYALAAVSSQDNFKGIGLDIESITNKRPLKIFNRILNKEEFQWIYSDETVEDEKFIFALKIFSAKEACYKAFYSASNTKLTFHDVSFHPAEDSKLKGTLLKAIPHFHKGYRFNVNSTIQNEFVVSGVSFEL